MSTNKQAVIRYRVLDKCFSNFWKRYYIEDLVEECCKAIYEFSGIKDGVKKRQIMDDIQFMESEEGYSVPLDKNRDGKRKYYRYEDRNFSINKQPLTPTEAEQLKNTIFMLNRFEGLPNFDWMDEVVARLENAFKLKNNETSVVSFEQNKYLKGLEYFSKLFNSIINKQVLKIYYRVSFNKPRQYIIHPYYLKQYNNRWFLFGLTHVDGENKIMNMAIDRIDQIDDIRLPYIENTKTDFNEYFDDIVGVSVSYKNESKVEKIKLKVDNVIYNYIESKPIHPSQTEKERTADYAIIELTLIPNFEFETILLGFSNKLEILSPDSLRQRICKRASDILDRNKR